MSLPHALLTALIEHPCSGSELAERFDRSIGHFWQATHQQIYKELRRLEEAGYVQALAPESGRGRKRAYRVLPGGREELKRWITEVEEPKPARDALLVRLRAEAAVGPTGLNDEISRRIDYHRRKLARYLAIEQRDFPAGELSRQKQLQHLVLKAGIMNETMRVAFSEETLATLTRTDKPGPG